MALVIEDGTGKPDAESFATVLEARTFATRRGFTLPADDTAVESLLVKAADYFRTLSFLGTRLVATQALAFPREGIEVEGEVLEPSPIPVNVKNAQIQLAVYAVTQDLNPVGAGREVIKQKVDVIEQEFAPTGSGSVTPVFNAALSWLSDYLDDSTSSGVNAKITRA